MEWLKRIGKFIEGDSVRNIPIEEVYGQLLKYHQELLQLFPPQGNLSPPRLIMFEPWPSARDIQAMPDKLTSAEASELATLIQTYQLMGEAFYIPKYNAQFIDRGSLDSRRKLDEILAEEIGHQIVRLPEDQVPLTVEVMETLNGPMPDFGRKLAASLKASPPLERMAKGNVLDPYPLSMGEFFPPLFVTYLTGQEYPTTPADFFQGRLTESFINHLPLLAGKMLVAQHGGDVKAVVDNYPMLTKVNGQQFWDQYCLPILTTGKI